MTAPQDPPPAPGDPGVGASGAAGSARAVPYCCPFCGEEDLRPLERGAVLSSGVRLDRGAWHCRSCLRVFSLTFAGLHSAAPTVPVVGGSDRS